MKKLPLLILAALFATTAHAAEYSIFRADKSTLSFVSKQMGVAVNGRFPKFSASVVFDPAKPERGNVNFNIDLTSIDAGSQDANDEIVGKDWFDVRKHPIATFKSATMKAIGGGRYEVSGPLVIKGKTKPVSAAFSFKAEGADGVFEGGFLLKRIDYAIGEGAWADISMVANDVQVNFRIVASATAPQSPIGKSLIPAKSK